MNKSILKKTSDNSLFRLLHKTDDIMTIKDVARYLLLHPLTVYRLVCKGEIPAFKVGKQWRIKREMLEKWIEDKIRSPLKGKKERER